jgi:DUF971 family protein
MDPDRIRPLKVTPFPNGELGVVWADGHDTGIYSFDRLRDLCPCGDCGTRLA